MGCKSGSNGSIESPAACELGSGEPDWHNHHHLLCRNCGAVKDPDCVVGHPTCLDPVDDAGCLVGKADVTFWGLCP
jgi:Fe2+ or Zn2+ uptake regulation protein